MSHLLTVLEDFTSIGHESEKDIATSLYDKEPSTRQCQLVIDWLEKNAEDKLQDTLESSHFQFSSDSVAWEHTLHAIQGIGDTHRFANDIVTELDPDAPIRQQKKLAHLDQEDEYQLLRYIFLYLRAGKLEEAQDLCIKYGQPWRAATLDGWRLWHDSNRDSDNGQNRELQPTEGNPYRDIWKVACWQMSQDNTFTVYEKAIYAALSGNLEQLLKVCHSWEDYLWAHFRVLVDVRVEQELRLFSNSARLLEKLPASYWDESQSLSPEQIFEQLNATKDDNIQREGCESFHVFQKHIILNEMDELMDDFESRIEHQDIESSHLLRFMSHMGLFLQSVGLQVKDDVCTKVLKKYIKVLIDMKEIHLIASYTAQLPSEDQIDVYSKFLSDITDTEDKQKCLEYARNAGLDVGAITKKVVEEIRDAPMNIDDGSSANLDITKDDNKKIDAVDWLVFDPTQRREAIKQANAIMRSFIAAKKLDCANQVMDKMPLDTIDVVHKEWQKQAGNDTLPAADDNAIKEFLSIKCYLSAHDVFNDWFQHFNHDAPVKPKLETWSNFQEQITFQESMKRYEAEHERWERSLAIHTEKATDALYNVLLFPGGWLVDDKEEEDSERRLGTLTIIRRLCLPLITFLLHNVLHSTGKYNECIRLADLIQEETHALYTVFHRDELHKLLELIRDSSICLLDERKDAFGFETN